VTERRREKGPIKSNRPLEGQKGKTRSKNHPLIYHGKRKTKDKANAQKPLGLGRGAEATAGENKPMG